MITTKADKLLRSLIDAGLSLTDFTILATKVIRIQRDFKIDNEGRRHRDHLRQQDKLREQYQFEQQLKEEEQRRIKGLAKLRELGYVTGDDTYQIDSYDEYSINEKGNKDNKIKTEQLLLPYSKEINDMKQKQRDCCLIFNIDYDLRLNQQTLERACRRAKRDIYQLRAERFNRPESRSVLSVETVTLHNKLKDTIREINKIFLESKSNQDKRHLQELLTYINQFEGDIDLLMCQMQYEPKVKETILFSPVTTDILDRMNLILYYVRTLAKNISTGDYTNEQNENIEEDINNPLSPIPTKVTYIIKLKTNNELSSSLSNETNVTMKLYGTYNKSPDIRLVQSIHKTKWQSGQIDLFNIELNYLGDIYAIEIWHDGQYSSWKVDWIEIIDDAANIYRFPLDRLFDKYSQEKKTRFIIQRDIGPVNRLPSKPLKQIKPYKQIGFSTYTVQVKTGKQPNKVTDSLIFIQIKGENGEFVDNLCSANSALKSSVFEPDQTDTFYLIWPYLAKIHSLHLLVQSEGIQPAWFCEYITVEDSQTGDQYKFIINQLFDGSNPDDPNLIRQLTVYPENTNEKDNKEEKDKPGYLLKLQTGEKGLSNMSTLPSINIILKGEKGKSEPYVFKSLDNKRKLFQENQIDEFLLSSKYYVGPIKTLQLSANDQIDKWFIETIIIRDIIQGQDYIFPIYKWINTQDGTNTLTVQPINERKPDYIVYTRTISSELKGPDRTIKLLIQGNKGKHEIELNNPVTMFNTFQSGRKDEYYIENMKSLGDLQSIEIDITHPNIKKLGLDYIEIQDLTTNNSYRFNINRMLDSKNPKMIAKAEPIPRSIKNSSSSKASRNQLPLPNNTNKKPFDQLTTNIPQGAKRSISNSIPKSTSEHENSFIIKIKTANKQFRDKDTKLQIELIDEDIHTRRSHSVSSSRIPSTNSNQISHTASPSPTQSHPSKIATNSARTDSVSNKIPTDSFSVSTKTYDETTRGKSQLTSSMIIDPTFNKFNSQPNNQTVSAVTIHTIATKSDSDSNLTRKSIDSRESENSVRSKSLLSPDTAKKSRKNRRRERRQNEQTTIHQSPMITPNPLTTNKLNNYIPSDNNRYLTKETSNVQSATQSITSQETKSRQTAVGSHAKDILLQYTPKLSLNAPSTTNNSLVSTTTTQNHRLPNEVSDIDHSTTHRKQSIATKTNSNLPVKLNGVDYMSTVYEESEPSTVSASHGLTSSVSEHDYNQENIQDWLETSSTLSSSQQNLPSNHSNIPIHRKIKSSSKEKSNQ